MIVVPAAFTLHTVHISALNTTTATTPGASPYGYTVSLLLFIIPFLVIALWFIPQEAVKIRRKVFAGPSACSFPSAPASTSSSPATSSPSPTQSATLGIKAPALGSPVPIEEYVFYLTGFLCVLLLYIWLDEYWLSAYHVETESTQRKQFHRLLQLHPESIILAVILVAGAIIYKKHFSPLRPASPATSSSSH